MKIHISPRHLRLTESIELYVVSRLEPLAELTAGIVSAHVILASEDTADPANKFHVSTRLAVAGPDIHAEEFGADLYAAVDSMISKLARQLRKRKTRLNDKQRSRVQRAAESGRREAA
jgi:putative sigma-54 modulation protein